MATMSETPKATPPTQEHSYPPAVIPYPHQGFNGGPYPPGPPAGYTQPYFAYPAPPDSNHGEATQNGVPPGPPFMMAYPPPPGMVYAYPPPQSQGFASPPVQMPPAALSRPKRKQVKMACTNCAAACKRCDENRPCERCQKYGVSDSCVDGQRKERKKGIKRGPYRRKNKTGSEGSPTYSGEWAAGSQSPPSNATTAAALQAVAHQYAPPEGGYFQVYYPPPGAYMHPHDGQPTPDGSPANGQPPMMPYFIHPGGYPPFPHYQQMFPPQAGPPQPQQPAAQLQTMDPTAANKKAEEPVAEDASATPQEVPALAPAPNKKRARGSKTGEPKPKKAKINGARIAKDKEDQRAAALTAQDSGTA